MIYDVRLEWNYIEFKKLFSRTSWLIPHEHEMSPDSQRRLDDLNRKRQGLQKSISQTFAPFKDVCRDCGGVCCYGHGSFYRAIDYWMREARRRCPTAFVCQRERGSDNPEALVLHAVPVSGDFWQALRLHQRKQERQGKESVRVPHGLRLPSRCFRWAGPLHRLGVPVAPEGYESQEQDPIHRTREAPLYDLSENRRSDPDRT